MKKLVDFLPAYENYIPSREAKEAKAQKTRAKLAEVFRTTTRKYLKPQTRRLPLNSFKNLLFRKIKNMRAKKNMMAKSTPDLVEQIIEKVINLPKTQAKKTKAKKAPAKKTQAKTKAPLKVNSALTLAKVKTYYGPAIYKIFEDWAGDNTLINFNKSIVDEKEETINEFNAHLSTL
jgi:hypothetical protein